MGAGTLRWQASAEGTTPAPSEATDPRIVVVPARFEGDVSEVARFRIEGALLDELRRRGLELVEPQDVMAAEPSADECGDDACLQKLVQRMHGTHALQLVVRAEGRDYAIRLTLVDASGREAELESECPICGFDEVGELVAEEAGKLERRIEAVEVPARLRVRSTPAGASVFVDDEVVGVTPLEISVVPGKHQVRLEYDGYFGQSRDLVSISGADESMEVTLQEMPTAGPGRLWIPGWTALGVGVAGVVTGAALLVVHHRPVPSRCGPESTDVNGVCRWRYDTVAGGATTMALGIGGVVAGAVLLILDKKARSGRRTQVYAAPGGVGLRHRF